MDDDHAETPADPSTSTISVFLLDDHEMVRRGLIDLLRAEPDLEVVGDTDTAADAIKMIDALRPDVAVLDISLGDGDGNGIDVCRQVTSDIPGVACLMLTSVDDERALLAAEQAGAAGFALKSVRSMDLANNIRNVAGGAHEIDAVALRGARRRLDERGEGLVETLTQQERRIFSLIGEGYSNRQIADTMYLAEKTVKNYVSNVLAKLNVERRTEVAALAARLAERATSWQPDG